MFMFIPGENRKKLIRQPEQFRIVHREVVHHGLPMYFVEQEPQIRPTKWCLGDHGRDYVLSHPRMLFGIRFLRGAYQNLFAVYLKAPFTGPETPLFQTILPNTADTGWVCLGDESTKDQVMAETYTAEGWPAKIEIVLDWFWNRTAWNDHVIHRFRDRAPRIHPNLRNLLTWERATRQGPNFVFRCGWQPLGTLESWIRRINEEEL